MMQPRHNGRIGNISVSLDRSTQLRAADDRGIYASAASRTVLIELAAQMHTASDATTTEATSLSNRSETLSGLSDLP